MSTYVHQGRTYQVMAQFQGPDRDKKLREYMRCTVQVRVLCDEKDVITVVSENDRGRLPPKPDDWDQGWTSLLDGGVRYKQDAQE